MVRVKYVSLHHHSTFSEVHICDTDCEVISLGVGRPPTPWCKRFADKIVYQDDCWLWKNVIGRTDAQRNRLNFATGVPGVPHSMDACRWIYEKTIGWFPQHLTIDHVICNDWRCVNPFHMEPVTNAENNSRYASIRSEWTERDELGRFAGRRTPNGVR